MARLARPLSLNSLCRDDADAQKPYNFTTESPEVCQFSSTEAISQHCYNISASNFVKRFFKGLGTFAFTNYVKISAL